MDPNSVTRSQITEGSSSLHCREAHGCKHAHTCTYVFKVFQTLSYILQLQSVAHALRGRLLLTPCARAAGGRATGDRAMCDRATSRAFHKGVKHLR